MSAKRKTLEEMMAEDAPTAEEQLAFANQIIAQGDELLAQAEHDEKRLGDRVKTLRETAPQATGARGGKTMRKQRVDIEKFMADQLARGTPREVILDGAERRSDLKRETLERYYLRPVLKRMRPAP